MRRIITLIIVFIVFVGSAFAQLSQGGKPLDILGLKSVSARKYIELTPSKDSLAKAMEANKSESTLKPFIFALSIPVNFNTDNSGAWYNYDEFNVWQLAIHSEGARSINVIFDKYHLPEGARLFLFSEDKSDLLGAFTATNNQEDFVFATSPVVGDKIIIQYEEPADAEFSGELSLKSVNHDFIGIKSAGDERRPLGESGSCNVNVNCDYLEAYRLAANSVCRILVSGIELCTGTLINNTSNDETPYVYTAGHCITKASEATSSVFLFNYESPYCSSIDGENDHSLSGCTLKASSDSLDFSLVQLNSKPPKSFRPYYLGWDRSTGLPDSTVAIHHPLGDIKKIAVDRHEPLIKSYSSGTTSKYVRNAFFLIGNWEEGTTEGGSSGAPLIDQKLQLVGSLTGGAATCEIPINDYFSRFAIAWDHYATQSKQLKAWLDPTNTGKTSINGLNPYDGADLCGAFTNLIDTDAHENLIIDNNKGYWGGSNEYGFTSFAEKFSFNSDCEIEGVSLGVALAYTESQFSNSTIRIDVYSGGNSPENILYSQDYDLSDIEEGVMNYFGFDQPVVSPTGKFFIAYSIENVLPTDSFSVYIAKREVNPYNTFYIEDGSEDWYPYNDKSGTIEGASILMEAIACGIDTILSNNQLKVVKNEPKVYPNPLASGKKLFVEFSYVINPHIVRAFDLIGNRVQVTYSQPGEKWLNFDFSGRLPGLYYLVIIDKSGKEYKLKVTYMGY